MSVTLFRIAAALCFLAVALGAFGAHALKATLQSNGMLDVWNKAVLYHFLHAIALIVLALARRRKSRRLFPDPAAGIVFFSGSLYALALTECPLARRDHARLAAFAFWPAGPGWSFRRRVDACRSCQPDASGDSQSPTKTRRRSQIATLARFPKSPPSAIRRLQTAIAPQRRLSPSLSPLISCRS